jgi:PadR family transcriptional regulator PadR
MTAADRTRNTLGGAMEMHSENSRAVKKFKKELSSGTTALVLLSVLDQAAEPMYGYQIAKHIGAGEEDVPTVKQGALYPVLRSLEANHLLESHVEPSVSGPPRRYYTITASGRETLEQWKAIWGQTKEFVDIILYGGSYD